jgi:hypothetical protein
MKEDNKIFWKFIKSKTKAKESIPCILDDEGGINTDDKTKSELLNIFFQSIFCFVLWIFIVPVFLPKLSLFYKCNLTFFV